jgi:hypothetical protein
VNHPPAFGPMVDTKREGDKLYSELRALTGQ